MIEKEKNFNILFLPIWYPNKEDPVNGVYILEHAKAVSLYNEVIVIHSKGVKNIRRFYEVLSDKKEDGIRTIRIEHRKISIPGITNLIYPLGIWKTFKNLIEEGWEPDIIHAHVFSSGVAAVILGRIYRIPVIITEHWAGFRSSISKIAIIASRFAMNRASIILPVSRDLKEAIESFGIVNRFEIVPNVVNTKMFYPITKMKDENPKRILLVAQLYDIKGIPYLLQALAQLKERRQDYFLDVIGDGPKHGEYENLAKNLGIGHQVRFHRLKPKEAIAEFMRNCDFFVLPSLYETFGVVYIEAMACGKPVIATDVGGAKEFITKDVGVTVLPRDVDTLARAIEYMLDHYKDYSPKKIARYVKERFSYNVVGKQLDNIYRRLKSKNL